MPQFKIKEKGRCGGHFIITCDTREEAKKFGDEHIGKGKFTVRELKPDYSPLYD